MPIQKLQFKPGINREGTTLTNKGSWYEGDKIRFRSGTVEKIGGWVLDTGTSASTLVPTTGAFFGTCRALWNWATLSGNNLLAVGTSQKYYVQNGTNGYLYDITPIRATSAAGAATFAASNGSKTLTVTQTNHGAGPGDFVTFSGAVSLGGNITASVLNTEFQILTVPNSNQYTIQATVFASAGDVGNGGAATVATYQINSGSATSTSLSGWGAGTWGGTVSGVLTTTLSGGITAIATTITLASVAGFPTGTTTTIKIDNELITYNGIVGSTLQSCVRGVSGTTAAAHSAGATVQLATSFTGWGASASTTTTTSQLRLWSQSNYGQDLIFNPRGGALYYWAFSGLTYNRATVMSGSNTPSVSNYVMVADAQRMVVAFGVNDPYSASPTTQDPMLIRWSDQNDYTNWVPAISNQAGSYRLSHGSQIMMGQQARQEILVWTDAALYSMQYVGAPYVWGFQLLADNISIMSQNAASTVNNTTFWMGTDKFYRYSGRVDTLYCALRHYIFDNINISQASQFFSGTNEAYNEVWWFYCSKNSTTIDRYVIYNHLEDLWYYGSLARTAWLDSPIRDYPMAAGYDGQLIYHENGVDDGTTSPVSAINSYVTSSDIDIGDGDRYGFVWRVIPDMDFEGSNVAAPTAYITLLPRRNPGASYGITNVQNVVSDNDYAITNSYLVQRFTQQITVRARGRQIAFKVGSNTLGTQWQLGFPRMDVRADGRKT